MAGRALLVVTKTLLGCCYVPSSEEQNKGPPVKLHCMATGTRYQCLSLRGSNPAAPVTVATACYSLLKPESVANPKLGPVLGQYYPSASEMGRGAEKVSVVNLLRVNSDGRPLKKMGSLNGTSREIQTGSK